MEGFEPRSVEGASLLEGLGGMPLDNFWKFNAKWCFWGNLEKKIEFNSAYWFRTPSLIVLVGFQGGGVVRTPRTPWLRYDVSGANHKQQKIKKAIHQTYKEEFYRANSTLSLILFITFTDVSTDCRSLSVTDRT